MPKELDRANFTVVCTQKVVQNKKLPATIDDTVTSVHIHGHLFFWILKEILKRAPHLKVLRVIPKALWKLTDSHRALLNERGVQLVTGHQRPEFVWHFEKRLPKEYEAQQKYLKNLPGPQYELFDELLTYGLKPALIASRYFCLNNEPRVTLTNLLREFGQLEHPSHTHDIVHGVLHYLNPRPDSAKGVKREATQLKNKVARIRLRNQKKAEKDEEIERLTQNLGIETLPKGLRPLQYAVFEQVWRAFQSGRLESVLGKDSREFCVVKQLWGLENGAVSTPKQVGEIYRVCRECIRQIEKSAFEKVGVSK
ncbi:MAG: hypothetical protein Q8R17_02720 [bacterium]|nr:hypothetical protein [bacterium]